MDGVAGDRRRGGHAGVCDISTGIAFVNLVVLRSIYRAFVRVRGGAPYVDEDFDMLLADRGFFPGLFRPMFDLITPQLAHVSAGCAVWPGLSTQPPRSGCWEFQRPRHRRACPSTRSGIPRAFRRGHVADRHDGQHPDAGGLWLGLHQAGTQAVLTT